MSDFREANIEFEIMGTMFDLIVEYRITSYGTPDGWMEPGDPPEMEIDKVTNLRTGEDMTKWLDSVHDWNSTEYKPWISLVNYPMPKGVWYNKIRSHMFDHDGRQFIRKLNWNAETLLSSIHDIVYQLEPFEYDDPWEGYEPD